MAAVIHNLKQIRRGRRASPTTAGIAPATTRLEAADLTTTTAAATTTATTTADPTGTVTEPESDQPATTTSTPTVTTTVTGTETDEAATTTTTTAVPAVTVPIPDEPDEWWTYNPELEWTVIDRDRLAVENVYPTGLIEDAVRVAQQVEAFWAWYMVWGHPQGPALDLYQPDHRAWLAGDAVDQLMYLHHRFWQERLPVWDEVGSSRPPLTRGNGRGSGSLSPPQPDSVSSSQLRASPR